MKQARMMRKRFISDQLLRTPNVFAVNPLISNVVVSQIYLHMGAYDLCCFHVFNVDSKKC